MHIILFCGFFTLMCFWKYAINQLVVKCDEWKKTAGDYTVILSGLPVQSGLEDIKELKVILCIPVEMKAPSHAMS